MLNHKTFTNSQDLPDAGPLKGSVRYMDPQSWYSAIHQPVKSTRHTLWPLATVDENSDFAKTLRKHASGTISPRMSIS